MFVMLQWNKLASEQNLRFSFSKNPNYFFLFLRSNTIFFYFCNQIRSRCFHPWTRYFSRWKVLRGICEEVARNAAERTFPGPGHRISKRRMSAHSPSEMRRQWREPFFCNFSDTHIASCLWNSSSCCWLISPAECVVCSVLCGVLVFFKSEKVQALFTTFRAMYPLWGAPYHQTFFAVKSHSCALATSQPPIQVPQCSWAKCVNIGRARKQGAIWIECAGSRFDKVLYFNAFTNSLKQTFAQCKIS